MNLSGKQTGRLLEAINEHDLDEFAQTFAIDYHSEQPAHPGRAFIGRETARDHWANFFALIPDFRAEVLRFVCDGDSEWAEWRWYGTQTDGTPFEARGIIVVGVAEGSIAWGRLYMEPVESASEDHTSALSGPEP